jgi:uncharacterized metal-binding protein YceD (DUF177 family)
MSNQKISKFIDLEELYKKQVPYLFKPDNQDLESLKKSLNLLDIQDLKISCKILKVSDYSYKLNCNLEATVSQESVISLMPVVSKIEEKLSILALPENKVKADLEEDFDLDYEVYENGKIDLGVILFDHLSLALPTYPKLENEEFQI